MLGMLVAQHAAEGYSVFVVRGAGAWGLRTGLWHDVGAREA